MAGPSISTALSSTSIVVGGSAYDTATLSGATGDAGGTVTYYSYSNGFCSLGQTQSGQKTVTNGIVPNSDPFAYNTPGSYSWDAVYSGDAKNNGATSPCEPLNVVNQGSTTVTQTVTTTVTETTSVTSTTTVTLPGVTHTVTVTSTVTTTLPALVTTTTVTKTVGGGLVTTVTVTTGQTGTETPATAPAGFSFASPTAVALTGAGVVILASVGFVLYRRMLHQFATKPYDKATGSTIHSWSKLDVDRR